MKNKQGKVNAENIGGTYNHEHELKKKIASHKTESDATTPAKATSEKVKKTNSKEVPGVHAENVGGTTIGVRKSKENS